LVKIVGNKIISHIISGWPALKHRTHYPSDLPLSRQLHHERKIPGYFVFILHERVPTIRFAGHDVHPDLKGSIDGKVGVISSSDLSTD